MDEIKVYMLVAEPTVMTCDEAWERVSRGLFISQTAHEQPDPSPEDREALVSYTGDLHAILDALSEAWEDVRVVPMEGGDYEEGTRRLSVVLTFREREECVRQTEYDHLARGLARRLAVQQGRAA